MEVLEKKLRMKKKKRRRENKRKKKKKQNQENVPLSMLVIQAKVRSIYEDLISDEDEVKLFNHSSGWFSNFRKLYNDHNIKKNKQIRRINVPARWKF